MLDLKNTTLLFVETRAHEITRRVITDCVSKVNFGEVLVYTDDFDKIGLDGVRYIRCDDFPNKKLAGQFYYAHAMLGVHTDFALMLEWDAGIYDASKWRPEFFNYDYIGAPWPTSPHEHNRLDVGNGGFTLMSKRLGHFACDNVSRFPVDTDWTFCRMQRHNFEAAGFKWPGRDLASFFSWELGPRNPEHFGFHGAFNWEGCLTHDEIIERVRIMIKSPYLTIKMKDVFRTSPWIVNELTSEELATYHRTIPAGYTLRPRIPGMMSPQQRAALQLSMIKRRGFVSHTQKITGLKA